MTRTIGRIARVEEITEHVARAEAPYVSFRQVDPPERSPQPCPAFLFGPMDRALARQMYGQITLRPTGCFVLRDAAAGPTGIAIKDDVAFCADALNHHRPYVQAVAKRLNTEHLAVRHVGGPLVVLLGPSYEVYGHSLVDYMPRLWLLAVCGFDIAALKFLVPMRPPQWTLDLLHAAGIRPDQLVPCRFSDEIITTELLIVPTTLRTYERLAASFAAATRFWTRGLRDATPPGATPPPVGAPRRIFIARPAGTATRILANRREVEQLAQAHGFAIIQPETMSLLEQAALFGGADIVAGEYGSGLHNAVFARPGTFICALRGTLREPGCIQTGLGHALGQHTGYVLGPTRGEGRSQSFTVGPDDFRLALNRMLPTSI